MARASVTFPRPRIADVAGEVRRRLEELSPPRLAGRRIAVTAGSRGIRDIVPVLAAAVAWIREQGGDPVIVGAMGSHGGGTEEGQRRLLAHLGITPERVGAPVLTSMETVELGTTPRGLIAYCDRNAVACDGILVVNRIKPHTAFAEPFGSGLLKMIAVGLGKAPAAAQIHRQGPAEMGAAIESIAAVALTTRRILGGLAIIENAFDETARIAGVPPDAMPREERALFAEARALMPSLPVDALDVLIVDEVGKNYSGTGMDVNVVGRWRLPGMAEPAAPAIQRIVALRLSPESEGNAQGIGLADVVTRALVDAIDPVATYVNTLVSTYVQRAFVPVTMPTDRDAVEAALASLNLPDPAAARVVRIPNTLHLEECEVSESLIPELQTHPRVTVGSAEPMSFSDDGGLRRFEARGPSP
ncbi:MAG TPA: lactate racemase domain-containing protein [bacterium]|jgi:hypothetical protein|nr:lactate racemase domain-containing protein [bacterium]